MRLITLLTRQDRRKRVIRSCIQLQFLFFALISCLSLALSSCGSGTSTPSLQTDSPLSTPPIESEPTNEPEPEPVPASPDSPPLLGQVLPPVMSSQVSDTIAPKVVSTIPKNEEVFVRKSTVTVLFSEPIDPTTLSANTFGVFVGDEKLEGEILMTMAIVDPRGVAAATFRPSRNLEPFAMHSAIVSAEIKDLAGNPIASDYSWNFRTGTVDDNLAPTVLSINPSANATDTAINRSIQVTFSEIMDPSSVTLGSFVLLKAGQKVSGTLSFEIDSTIRATVVTFLSENPLQYDTIYTINISYSVKDANGIPMERDFTSDFRTLSSATAQGYAFSQPIKLSGSFYTNFSRFEVSPLGGIYAFWDNGGTFLSRSVDGGATFSSPQKILEGQVVGAVGFRGDIMDLGVGYSVTQERNGTSFSHAELAYSHSTDGGAHFSTPVPISSSDEFQSWGASIASINNLVGIVWEDYIIKVQFAGFDNFFKPIIMFRRSLDGGDTFSTPLALSGLQTIGTHPRIAVSDAQQINIIWQNEFGNILFSRSTDAGEIFSPPLQLSNAQNQVWNPNIFVEENGTLDVVWEEGHAFDRRMFLSRSVDGGVSFSMPSVLPIPSGDYVCASVRVSPFGQFAIGWTVGNPFFIQSKSFFAISNDGVVFSSSAEIPVMNGISFCPTVVSEPNETGNLHFMWSNYPYNSFPQGIYYSKAISLQ